ncbi:DUF1549 and DUF1553 domain-containing protein [Polyangium aurulentum]|uniref:DUF1549 and DUF1553 domain-containing protein n=1 Tax=Polyangium aurulentum TaxID=2567896 RepID=UPI0010AE3B82|nr:DUF1549 and DUF1553 domain-containing protein [Polyangium aurulentum]UQA54583.1 DUF1549 and DUF1553 domain-containing protein [Polyangium aurulentum]
MLRRTWPWVVVAALSACSGSCAGTPAPSPSTVNTAAKPATAPAPAPAVDIVARVDALLEAEWKTSNVSPAKPATDAQFLRRAYLDLAGTLPPPEAVTAFLSDRSPDKRARAIETLLASPRYVERWSAYWEEVLLRDKAKANLVDRAAFRTWLRARFAENAPWDRVTRDLVTATGKSSPGGSARDRRVAAETGAADADSEGVNGAVNWLLQFNRATEDLAGATSRTFLGVQIQCAQCHDHKTEKWTTGDFRRFAAAFARTRVSAVEDKEKGMMRTFEVSDAEKAARPGKKATEEQREIATLAPTALDGTELAGEVPRAQLAAWITSQTNPWFARATVNRMWALLLGHGFVEPIDDLRPSNPPRAAPVLDALAADFSAHGYDLKRLIRSICATRAYGLSAGAPEAEAAWAAFRPRALPAPVLLDAILAATRLDPLLEETLGERADALRAKMRKNFRFVFDVDEGGESDDFEGTIPQALLLLNGPLVGHGASALQGTTLADVLAMPGGDAAKIEALYLRTLSRKPSAEETARWVSFLDEAAAAPEEKSARPAEKGPLARLRKKAVARTPRDRAYEDLFWALLDSSEFAFQH